MENQIRWTVRISQEIEIVNKWIEKLKGKIRIY
jgi:hypothetical protein